MIQDPDSEADREDVLTDDRDTSSRDTLAHVPVVGIGASAGGLEAMKEFLSATPTDTGACFVFVQHLDPGHKSMLTELLGRCTQMPVHQAEDGMEVVPNHLIIIPPDSTLRIHKGELRLERPAPPRLHRTPIDSFFHSLAADQGDRAIAIILSGTGSDGTQGLKAVKEAGGFTIIQSPEAAKYDSMPRNAAATGLVDRTLPAGEMPGCLIEYLSHIRQEAEQNGRTESHRELREQLARVCGLLKVNTGHDFREYKEPTLIRRVQRRMQVLRITEIAEYVQRLREDKKETRQLFRELLVSVTGFFRDSQGFEALSQRVLDPLVRDRDESDVIRVWVPGCATGEEAYSIAMALRETIDQHEKALRVQVFATDIDEAALEVARRAIYPESIAAYVPERLLKRFFRAVGGDYQVTEEIRSLCIFSTQSLIKDPPFSRLDVISCRNLLIYLKTELQNRLIPVFHYALRPNGFLFLGPSENVSRHRQLFEIVDKKWRIFRRRDTSDRPQVRFPLIDLVARAQERDRTSPPPQEATKSRHEVVVSLAERAILDELGPAYVVVGENRELVYSGGRIDPFLKLRRGAPSLEITAIAHQGLRLDIRAILHRATTEQVEVTRDDISIETSEGRRRLTLTCRPLGADRDAVRHYLLVFRDLGPLQVEAKADETGGDDASQVQALESELRATKEYLQTTTEELESSNEELKSANEELMSMNEELQSSNQELETSKEELQSVNEELETVNAELASKVDELGRSNADLQNLLESTQIATLFLDRSMRIRRFTPVAKEIFHLIDSDLGRSISDIASRFQAVDLADEAQTVLDKLLPVEREVTLRDSKAIYMMRLLPYRTPGEVIDGVVATFVDVTRLKAAQQEIGELNAQLELQVEDLRALLDLAPIGIAFADNPECRTIEVNRYGAQIMKIGRTTPPAGDPKVGYRFVRDDKDLPPEDLPLQRAWRTGKPVRDFRATYVPEDGAAFEFHMSSAPVFDKDGRIRRVIGVYDDITRLVTAQAASETRAAQQDFVATTGSLSLRGHSGEQLVAALPEQLARILKIELVKLLVYHPETGDFRLEASYGFQEPRGTIVAGGLNSQAGYTVQSAAPVIVQDLAQEKRFNGPLLLREAGVVSGVSVLIGDPEKPWGVLGVHSRQAMTFTADDIKFLQAIANVIAATVERDSWSRHQRLLLDELRHRVKNSLATVQALASLSFRGRRMTPDVVKGFVARLQTLALAHDLHFEHDGQEVDFEELVRRQVEPYDQQGGRIRISGPARTRLPAGTAIDMAMAVHELVTNAVKHGALSSNGGKVEAKWQVNGRGDAASIVFDWKERGGPKVDAPGGEGVGSKLLTAIAQRTRFRIDRTFEPDGLRCRIEIMRDH